jgi:hypothetical protein
MEYAKNRNIAPVEQQTKTQKLEAPATCFRGAKKIPTVTERIDISFYYD